MSRHSKQRRKPPRRPPEAPQRPIPPAPANASPDAERDFLRRAASDLAFWARRYCDGRSTGAPSSYNDIARQLIGLGISLQPDPIANNSVWAQDGGGRAYDGLAEDCLKPDSPGSRGEYIPLPPGARLTDELTAALGTTDPHEALCRIEKQAANLKRVRSEARRMRRALTAVVSVYDAGGKFADAAEVARRGLGRNEE